MENKIMLQVYLDGDAVSLNNGQEVRTLIAFLEQYAALKDLVKPATATRKDVALEAPEHEAMPRQNNSPNSKNLRPLYIQALCNLGGYGTGEQVYEELKRIGLEFDARDPLRAVKSYLRQKGKFTRLNDTPEGKPVFGMSSDDLAVLEASLIKTN